MAENIILSIKDTTYLDLTHEQPIKDILESMGHSITLMDQNNINSINFNNYDAIIVTGTSEFIEQLEYTKNIPTLNHPTLAIYPHYVDDWGWVNANSLKIMTYFGQNIIYDDQGYNIVDHMAQDDAVQNPKKELVGMKKSYTNMTSLVHQSLSTTYGIIMLAEKGTSLSGGQTANENILFFGIDYPSYWTDETKEMFNKSMSWLLAGNEPPVVTLLTPTNGTEMISSNRYEFVDFFFNVTDDNSPTLECQMFCNMYNSFGNPNKNFISFGASKTVNNGENDSLFPGTQTRDDNITWNVKCYDGDNYAFASENFTFIINFQECQTDNDCDDNLYCNGEEYCDINNECQSGTSPVTEDNISCTVDSCSEATDSIIHSPNDGACSNSLFCDGQEVCDPELDCLAGTPPVFEDGITCTVDSCDEENDTVLNTPNNALCNNNLYCDGQEFCDTLLDCQNSTPIFCNDNDTSTDDFCDEGTDACIFEPSSCENDNECDDGLYCNGEEYCDGSGECQSGTIVNCSGNNTPDIGSCTYNPDNNSLTWDYAQGIEAVCDEESDTCTINDEYNFTHECDINNCNAECINDTSCTEITCEGSCENGTYYECDNVVNTCDSCSCTQNTCPEPTTCSVAGTDTDNDTIDNECNDNCPDLANPDQNDTDSDGIGDVCDQYPNDYDNDGIDDENDTITGNLSDVNFSNSYIENMIIGVNGSDNLSQQFNGIKKVVFRRASGTIIEFYYNFSPNNKLNLKGVEIISETNESEPAYIIIKGLNLSGSTKTVYMKKNLDDSEKVCILDIEVSAISEMSNDCDDNDEVLITCNGNEKEGFTCTVSEDSLYYIISGLKHSAIKEIDSNNAPVLVKKKSSGGGGGGGGGSNLPTEEIPVPEKEPLVAFRSAVPDKQEEASEDVVELADNTNTSNEDYMTAKKSGRVSAITGAVIGAIGSTGGTTFIVLIVLIAAMLGVYYYSKNKKNIMRKFKLK